MRVGGRATKTAKIPMSASADSDISFASDKDFVEARKRRQARLERN
jgi:hypothetical protein